MKNNLIKTTADKLQKGDIFSFGSNFWDEEQRFHSYSFYSNAKGWHDDYSEGSKICFNYIPFNYAGEIENACAHAFQWSNEQDPSKITVYIQANHLISDTKKYKGWLYYNDHNNQRVYVRYKVNPVNMLPVT
jgi:hypothetical protein